MITKEARHEVEASPLRNLLQQVLDAWERGDGRALAAAFVDDGDVIIFDGSHLHGGPQIAAVMQHLFDTALKGTRCLAQVKALRFVTPEVALMQTLGGVVFPGETVVPAERCSIQTFVVVRIPGTWRVASLQNTWMQGASPGGPTPRR
jgi:uncharacterized protein (TIGR02246 family)